MQEGMNIEGVYEVECIGSDGQVKWREIIENTVVTVGKNLALNTFLSGSAYTVVGPYMGLIGSGSFSGISSGDTMASHSGWQECGNANPPTYSGTRNTCVFASASGGSISLTSALSFSMTGSGTVEGCFLVYGSGAVNTIDSTAGTLFSAGLFSSGTKTVGNGDTINVSYTASM